MSLKIINDKNRIYLFLFIALNLIYLLHTMDILQEKQITEIKNKVE